ncbi:MerR family transcriptional regulator [Acinetobacter larvae]|uniref:Cd(II)/Pb(II)-responsive transcriptional regulator n=1 Tax=Acinetobacter larvae TaxID=1789224 RepID=A0A1B2M3C1_9GAMM|nr:MerR family transcriptional regulator [Acinetobacter larvae]AOA59700.1 Cd(II)/Pb(II)-responsive transcriptional regulator [Acinetobacter larvae]
MKIGEMAQQVGCSVETIRFYEKAGLLPKALRNIENNYRDYQHVHLERLRFIRRCRSLGMTHDEIRTLLDAKKNIDGCHAINDVIAMHLAHVQHRLHELQALEQELQRLQQQCQGFDGVEDCGILRALESEHIPQTIDAHDHVHDANICRGH